ncbi:epoxide hydrolase 1 [Amyelois transitella]|uniref:epoxide hydrolase 1 n=1 Tax=Amyelois transitella TaxID=680683 RepID=UPI00067C84B3|nr:epoxide hydrolase 1 [Amyelois transitella]
MSFATIAYRYVLTYFLSLLYTALALIGLSFNYVKKVITDPGYKNLKLLRPNCLVDPKYGVHKYIKVNNVKLHYVESGDPSKPLMLFLHGFPEFWYSWRHQILEFQKDYWCIAVDMRGYGDSERPEAVSAYKIDVLVEDVRDLVRQLGRENFILVAHDWGGVIACKFREVYPKLLSAVIVIASMSLESFIYSIFNDSKQRKLSWYVFFFQMPAIPEQFLEMNHLQVFDKMMMVPGKDTVSAEDLEAYKYWFGKQFAFTPPINYYRANFRFDVLDPQKRFTDKVPMLVVRAADDIAIGPQPMEYMKQVYEHLDTLVVQGCGHFMQQEEPAEVNNIIREFLAKQKP